MNKLEINGSLLTDILKGVSVIHHNFARESWWVLCRTYDKDAADPFIGYRTDEWGEFETIGWYRGDVRRVVKDFTDLMNGVTPAYSEPKKRGRPEGTFKYNK